MAITRSNKSKLDNYGVNLSVDKRTRAYANILKKNQWTDEQYTRYLKDIIKGFVAKEKKIVTQVARNKVREKVFENVREKNKTRYTGSTLIKLTIIEDKIVFLSWQTPTQVESFHSRQRTYHRNVFIEFHTLSFDKTVLDINAVNTILNCQINKLEKRLLQRSYVVNVNTNIIQSLLTNIRMRQSGSYNIDGYTEWWNPAGVLSMPLVEEDSCNR